MIGWVGLLGGCFDAGTEAGTRDAYSAASDVVDGSQVDDVTVTDGPSHDVPVQDAPDIDAAPDAVAQDVPSADVTPDTSDAGCSPTNGGVEICDGVDNDCNGVVDDGFDTGPCTVGMGACEATGEFVCVDDQSAECNVSPGTPGEELCGDGVDNDCDGTVDEDDAADAQTWYADNDGDGFGDADESVTACEKPSGYVSNDSDCDDSDANAYETVDGYADQDGDGYTTGSAQTFCTDGTLPDGYVGTQTDGDCDDTDADISPDADEMCDGVDNDCDGVVDEDSAVDAKTWFVDCDGDGFAADDRVSRTACERPTASTGCATSSATWTDLRPSGGSTTDCNDAVAEAYPGQTRWFSNPMTPGGYQISDWDYDCDGSIDYRWTATGGSCQDEIVDCNGTAGWVPNALTACGATEDFQECARKGQGCAPGTNICSSYYCDDDVIQRTQECR